MHAGLAVGAIRRYIYKPLRTGALRAGAPGRVAVLLEGAGAANALSAASAALGVCIKDIARNSADPEAGVV